jgi:hypothetical protein
MGISHTIDIISIKLQKQREKRMQFKQMQRIETILLPFCEDNNPHFLRRFVVFLETTENWYVIWWK